MLKGFLFPVNWSQKFIYAKFISPGSVLGYRIATVGWTEKTQISSEKQAHKFSGCQVTRQSPGHFQFHSEVSVAHYSLNLSISQFRGLTFNFKIKITYSWKSYYNLCQSPLKKIPDEANLFLGLWYHLQGQALADGVFSGNYTKMRLSNKNFFFLFL